MAKYSDKQNKWTQDYIKKAYDTILIRVPKGTKEEYKERAEVKGKSLNQYIADLVRKDIRREKMGKIEAMAKLYEEMDFENPDIAEDMKNDFLSECKCRNGREVLWYMDEANNKAIYIDTMEFLTDEEIEKELC